MRRTGLLIFFLIILIIYITGVLTAGEDSYFFEIEDPAGDDFGPGRYQYPTNKAFQDGEGLFDITGFAISREEEKYLFKFQFGKLTDPWASKYGFSLPLIQLYIDNTEGGSTELFREGANVRLDDRHPWDQLLVISGWWVRKITPADRDRDDNFWNTDANPLDVDDVEVKVIDNTLFVKLDQALLGELQGSSIFLLVGSFDPFGPDNYRTLKEERSAWSFFDPGNNDADSSPRVVDIITPPGKDQTAVLNDEKGLYPLIYPFQVRGSSNFLLLFELLKYGLILLILLIAVIILNKNFFFRDNKG